MLEERPKQNSEAGVWIVPRSQPRNREYKYLYHWIYTHDREQNSNVNAWIPDFLCEMRFAGGGLDFLGRGS